MCEGVCVVCFKRVCVVCVSNSAMYVVCECVGVHMCVVCALSRVMGTSVNLKNRFAGLLKLMPVCAIRGVWLVA